MPETSKPDLTQLNLAARLVSGTICITIRTPEGINDGRLVEVVGYVFPSDWEPYLVEGYLVRTLSSRPFAVTRHWESSPGGIACRAEYHEHFSAIADRAQLQPLGKLAQSYVPPEVPRVVRVHGMPPGLPLIVRRQ